MWPLVTGVKKVKMLVGGIVLTLLFRREASYGWSLTQMEGALHKMCPHTRCQTHPGSMCFRFLTSTTTTRRIPLHLQKLPDGGAFAEYTRIMENHDRFGNMLYPSTYADRDRAAVSLNNAGAFPIVADNDELYIYVPIRRYARGVIHPQPYSVIDGYLTPNDEVIPFQREEAVLAWAVRDLYWRNRVHREHSLVL